MAKGDRGSRGRREYGKTERERGHERREKERRERERRERSQNRRDRAAAKTAREKREKEARERVAREHAERAREAEKRKEAARKERARAEIERYESASEASDPSRGHSGEWGGGVTSYRTQAEAKRGERERRLRDRQDRNEYRKSQREELRRMAAADKASGGLGGTTEYGRTITDAEIDRQLTKDSYSDAANAAWNSGNYTGWLTNKMASTAMGFTNDAAIEFNDFVDSPLDYTSDVLRNPALGASLAVFAPQIALGAAGVKAADSVADYFQEEATGEEALKQGALDMADVIQNQGIATMARFLGDPTGTTGKSIGAGVAAALGGGALGATVGALTPGALEKVVTEEEKDLAMMSPAERRALKEKQAERRLSLDSDSEGRVSSSGISKTPSMKGVVTSQSGGRTLYTPSQDWMVDPMEIYGTQEIPTFNSTTSTKSPTNVKIDNKAARALTLMEQYPWMFDQGVLSMSNNPYAVVKT